ncbi:unnamed protein product [Orchesella dallaii]|uniref:Uncharacterized protein n=1 Tax=Orchesella dallaii TaxID=48710 RepID=A0ABP1Q384_9HEXA
MDYAFDFSGCAVTKCETMKGSTARAVLSLNNVSSQSGFEAAALARNGGFIMDIDYAQGTTFKLRFYFDKFEVVSKNGAQNRFLSLFVDVLGGPEMSHGLMFTVKVDRLTDALRLHDNHMPETLVSIKSKGDRRGKEVEKYFINYLWAPAVAQGGGSSRMLVNDEYLLDSRTENLNFGFTVTTIHSRSMRVRDPVRPGLANESMTMTEIDNEKIERDIKRLLAEAAESLLETQKDSSSPEIHRMYTNCLVPTFKPWILNGDSAAVWKIARWPLKERVVPELLGWLEMLNDEAIVLCNRDPMFETGFQGNEVRMEMAMKRIPELIEEFRNVIGSMHGGDF